MAQNQTNEGGFFQDIMKIFDISQDSLNSTPEKIDDANKSKEGSTPSTETSLRSSTISVKSLKDDSSEQLASDESQDRKPPSVDKSRNGLRRSSLMVDMLSGEVLDDIFYDSEAEDDDEEESFERVH